MRVRGQTILSCSFEIWFNKSDAFFVTSHPLDAWYFSFLHTIFFLTYCILKGDRAVILQEHSHGPQKSCKPAKCRDHFRLSPRSFWWLTDRARLSERQATLSATQTDSFSCHTSCNISHISLYKTSQSRTQLKSVYLVCLVNDDGVIGECFHNVEIFNSCCRSKNTNQLTDCHRSERTKQCWCNGHNGDYKKKKKKFELTFPV